MLGEVTPLLPPPRLFPPSSASARSRRVERSCRKVTAGAAPAPGNTVAGALASILDSLAQLPSHHIVGSRLRTPLHRILDALSAEYVASHRQGQLSPPFSTQDYFEIATDSIGILPIMLTLWAAMDVPDLPQHLPRFTDAARHACLTVGVANDLAGAEREHSEGTINALRLGFSRTQLQTELAHAQQQLLSTCQPLIDERYAPAIALNRCATWIVQLYQHQDFDRSAMSMPDPTSHNS
ncbi:terpene synthase family protein [Streptomyces sp. ZAF1911]|uniref:terpene synthase family protein n=1 Tax=Streptomyces sp. ZAF1911 TaxID=2944129 RepID=UPI00237B7E1E|nr:terpene synthase family protein [Streptomyces sp. ZAF1911]MDD9375142.1 terpene synthase family protein [Streptomyces sp. ZAF1911]